MIHILFSKTTIWMKGAQNARCAERFHSCRKKNIDSSNYCKGGCVRRKSAESTVLPQFHMNHSLIYMIFVNIFFI